MRTELNDFSLKSDWKTDLTGFSRRGRYGNRKIFVIDGNTNNLYFNQTLSTLRFKCAATAIGTPFIQAVYLTIKVFLRVIDIFRILCQPGSDWATKKSALFYEAMVIVLMPLIYIGLELAALYGLVDPRLGSKLYASLERLAGNEFYLGPCYQPYPQSHLFGGNPNNPNAW